MSSSSSDMIAIIYLENILSQINFYCGIFIFCFGILGNILNILVLSQRKLRSNSCVIIFLGSSTAGIIAILSGLTSRVLSGVTVDLSSTVNWLCKFRGFIIYTSRAVTFWLIMLATVDRWLLSCTDVHRRHMSSKKNALRSIIIVTILSSLLHSQLFYCYEANLINTPLKCYTRNLQCRLFNDFALAIITILFPLILIGIFGWMTIANIRKSRDRIERLTEIGFSRSTQTSNSQRRSKKIDQRLLVMLFVQVILLALFTLPVVIQKLYATLTINIQKSNLRITIENFIYQVTLIFTFFAFGMPFYVNTLSGGTVFRKGLCTLKNSILQKVLCK